MKGLKSPHRFGDLFNKPMILFDAIDRLFRERGGSTLQVYPYSP